MKADARTLKKTSKKVLKKLPTLSFKMVHFDNSSQNFSNETLEGVIMQEIPSMWRSVIILVFNCIFGSMGNSLVIMVYGNKTFTNSSDIFIFALACLDFATSVCYMPVSIYEILTLSQSAIVCVVDKGGSFAYVTTSFAIFICIVLDRLIAVNKPHDYKTIMSARRAKFLVGFCFLFGTFCSFPISKSCLTETTIDDSRQIQLLMKAYSAAVIILAVLFIG